MATKETLSASAIAEAKTKNERPAVVGGNGDYTADSIKVLGGMEAVRKRPAMYIGSTGERVPVQRRSFRLGERSLDDGFDALSVPADVLPSQLPLYIQDIKNREGHNLSIALQPVAKERYGREVQIRALAERYCYALASGADRIDVTSLVAVTFTRKANGELEARIRQKLVAYLFRQGYDSSLAVDVVREVMAG